MALTIAAFFLVGTIDVELNDTGFAICAGGLRDRRRPAALAARERDHVVGRPEQEQRGRRAPGHGAEPRRLARHGADRRGADLGPHDRLHHRGSRQPRRHAGRAARSSPTPIAAGIPVVPVDDVEQALLDAGVPPAEASAVADGLRRRPARGAEEVAARRGPARGRRARGSRAACPAGPRSRAPPSPRTAARGGFVDWPRGRDRACNRGRRARPGVQEGAAGRRRDRARGRARRDLRLPRARTAPASRPPC